jgi:mycothiol synthase
MAEALGLAPAREMVKMALHLAPEAARSQTQLRPPPPPGTAWHTFIKGQDEPAWLALNAAAFADHPEQGSLTAADLAWRTAQDWFNPNSFFLLKDQTSPHNPTYLGYIWLKVQNEVGEVYAIGVHPDAQGRRLGTALLQRGLELLARAGINQVELYVEANNVPAMAAYHRQGFRVVQRHVQYARST